MAMKLTETARVQLAQQFYSKTLWLAWGTSNTNWNDNPPAVYNNIIQRENELTPIYLLSEVNNRGLQEIFIHGNTRYSNNEVYEIRTNNRPISYTLT